MHWGRGYGGAVDVKRAAHLYALGWTLRQIGAELGVTANTVSEQLRGAGVTMRRGAPAHPASTQQILELRGQGLTWPEIAEQVDMTVSGAWSRYRRARPPKSPRLGRWQQVLADAPDQNPAIGVRAAVTDHLGRAPTRAELTAARRAAHGLATLGRARVLHVPGANGDANAGDRTYLVLAKPNVIMNDIRLRGLDVAGSDATGRKNPHNHAQTARNLQRSLRNAAAGARLIQAGVGQQIGCRRRSLSRRCPRRASPAPAHPRSTYPTRPMTPGLSPLACSIWIDVAAGTCHTSAALIAASLRWIATGRAVRSGRGRVSSKPAI